jgi:hypothetical protein
MGTCISVLVGCYGDYPQYSLRAVQSVLRTEGIKIHVGCNACSTETLGRLREWHDAGSIATLIESRENINKDPMMRLMVERTETEYLMWMDDDSHVLPGWDRTLRGLLQAHAPFDVAGHVFYCYRSDDYKSFLCGRPWWRGAEAYPNDDWRNRVWFATGGLWLARTAFLRHHGFPDRGMVKKQDDLLLGDLIGQQGGKLFDFGHHEIMQFARISDGHRRGVGEGRDGWKTG